METIFGRRMPRRRLIKIIAAAAGAAVTQGVVAPRVPAAAPASPSVSPAGTTSAVMKSSFDWRKYAGTTIRYIGWTDMWCTALEPRLPEFEQKTGIKVVWERYFTEQARQKVLTELMAKGKSLDLIHMAPHAEGLKYLRAGWLEPIDQYLANPNMVPPDFDVADFFPAFLDTCKVDGKQITMPSQIEIFCLIYRKDVFEKAGVKVPDNFDELEQTAKKLHNPPDMYGIVNRGAAKGVAVSWANYLYGFGGDYLTKDKKCSLTTPEAIASLEYYARVHRAYNPPGITAMDWNEAMAVFASGKAAMHTDANTRRMVINDPAKSKVADKTGYAIFPGGPVTRCMGNWTIGPALSKFSEKKEAAWYFILWSLSKENQLVTHLAGVAAARRSAWDDPRYKDNEKLPDWRETTLKSMPLSTKSYSPPVVAVTEVRDRYGEVVQAALEGKNIREEAAKGYADVEKILQRTEKL